MVVLGAGIHQLEARSATTKQELKQIYKLLYMCVSRTTHTEEKHMGMGNEEQEEKKRETRHSRKNEMKQD